MIKVTCAVCGKIIYYDKVHSLDGNKFICSKKCSLSYAVTGNGSKLQLKTAGIKSYRPGNKNRLHSGNSDKRLEECAKTTLYKQNAYLCFINAINFMVSDYEKDLKKNDMI
jgi:hypothetical protein